MGTLSDAWHAAGDLQGWGYVTWQQPAAFATAQAGLRSEASCPVVAAAAAYYSVMVVAVSVMSGAVWFEVCRVVTTTPVALLPCLYVFL